MQILQFSKERKNIIVSLKIETLVVCMIVFKNVSMSIEHTSSLMVINEIFIYVFVKSAYVVFFLCRLMWCFS